MTIFVWPKSRPITLRKSTTGIGIHCTATREGQDINALVVDGWHEAKKWAGIGYHYLIQLDGTIEAGRPEAAVGSHIQGHNSHLIGIVYVGGLDKAGKPKDTRTQAQKDSMKLLVRSLKAKYKLTNAKIGGHRDFSPDKDGDGIVEKHEWLKDCPCFDVASWLKSEGL